MSSKSQLHRLIKKEKETNVAKLMSAISKTELNENSVIDLQKDLDTEDRQFEKTEEDEDIAQEQTENLFSSYKRENESLNEKLRDWYLKHRPSRKCVEDLVKILRSENLNVTSSFFQFKVVVQPEIEEIAGGSYLHIGLAHQLRKIAEAIQIPDHLNIDINIDGLPLYRSSNTQLWPILIRVNNVKGMPVFPVGVFLGNRKPSNCEEYLFNFTSELSYYIENGIQLSEKNIKLAIRAIICDTFPRVSTWLCKVYTGREKGKPNLDIQYDIGKPNNRSRLW